MRAWLTIDEAGPIVCRSFLIPRNFVPHFMGAVGELCSFWNWEQDGTLTPEQCAELMGVAWESARAGCDMIGSIQAFGTDTLPAEYIPCDYGVYNRVDYPDLYAVIASALIIDADTFHTPKSENRAIVGAGGLYAVADEMGESTHALTANENGQHSHTIQHAYGDSVVLGYIGAIEALVATQTEETTSTSGLGSPHNNMQPSTAYLFGIRWKL